MTPDLKARCRAMLIHDEGLRLQVYHCTAGVLTVGCGHNLESHRHSFAQIEYYREHGVSRELALKWLNEDIDSAVNESIETVGADRWNTYGDVRKAGLVNWHFQLGGAGARGFVKSVEAIRAGDFSLASARMKSSKWFLHDTPARAERVIAAVCFEEFSKVYGGA